MATAKKRTSETDKKANVDKKSNVDENLVLVCNEFSEILGFNKPDDDGKTDPIPTGSNEQMTKDIQEEIDEKDIETYEFSPKVCKIIKATFGFKLTQKKEDKKAKKTEKSTESKEEKEDKTECKEDKKSKKDVKKSETKTEKPAKNTAKSEKADKPIKKAEKKSGKGRSYDKTSASSRLWKLWKNGKGIKDPEKLFEKLNDDIENPTIKLQSIKWMLHKWSKGERLPGIAKAE